MVTSSAITWQEIKSLAETNLHMLEEEILCDVAFLTGKNQTPVKAHKFILVSRSPVFSAMFVGPLAETNDAISVPDIEPETLKSLFRYMYTEKCNISGGNVMALRYAAKKYVITGLVKRCTDFLQEHIMPDNTCTILQHAVQLDEDKIVEKCLECVQTNGETVLLSEGFKSLDKITFKKVIESDNLRVDEDVVYTACLEWGKHQCELDGKDTSDGNIRECLGELAFLIRRPAESRETFTNSATKDVGQTADENVSDFHSIEDKSMNHGGVSRNPKETNRCCFVITRFGTVSPSWVHHGQVDAITFSSSEDVSLTGVGLFTPERSGGEVSGSLEITDDNKAILYKTTVALVYNSSKEFEDIIFELPLPLKKGVKYTLIQSFIGAPTYRGDTGIAAAANKNITLRFFNSTQSRNHTNVQVGQIYRLLMQN